MDQIDGWAVYNDLAASTWSSLTETQRALVAIGELRTEINNGGFEQYFFNSSGDHALIAREAAARSGPRALAALIDRAIVELGPRCSTNMTARGAGLAAPSEPPSFESVDAAYFKLEATENLDILMELLATNAEHQTSSHPARPILATTPDEQAGPWMSERMTQAVWDGDATTIRALVAEGESVNWTDPFGYSPLMLAVENQQIDSIQALLDAGADLSYSRDNGWTALHNAVDSVCDGEVQTRTPADGRVVQLLVDAGADVNAVWANRSDRPTPCDLARRYGSDAIIRILEA